MNWCMASLLLGARAAHGERQNLACTVHAFRVRGRFGYSLVRSCLKPNKYASFASPGFAAVAKVVRNMFLSILFLLSDAVIWYVVGTTADPSVVQPEIGTLCAPPLSESTSRAVVEIGK